MKNKFIVWIFFINVTIFYFMPSSLKAFSLMDVLNLGINNISNNEQMVQNDQIVRLKYQRLDKSRVQQNINSNLSKSVNEVADSRDLDARDSSETFQMTGGFQQTFINGFNWNISTTYRNESPTNISDTKDDQFSKFQLRFDYPLFGYLSLGKKILYEKDKLLIDFEKESYSLEQINFEAEIANAFFDMLIDFHKKKESDNFITVLKKQRQKYYNNVDFVPALDLKQLDYKILQAEQENIMREDILLESRKKLYIYVDNEIVQQTPEIDEPIDFDITSEIYTEKYLEKSQKLLKLKQDQLLKEKDLNIIKLKLRPDVSFGGYLGKTNTNIKDGNNYGAYMVVKYFFGGGESEQASVATLELKAISNEIRKTKQEHILKAKRDYQQIISKKKYISIRKQQYEQVKTQLNMASEQFDYGQISLESFINYCEKCLQAETALIQSKAEYWKHYISLLNNLQISPILYFSRKSN
ncbi:MAG: TolC family protein [Desulfobacterales bacterium]|nr:TolC family protein [Desulfobacterales bacterium]